MAHRYVRSGGTGGSWSGTVYTTLAAALTAGAAGDNFWVSEDHAETQASDIALNCPGTVSTPCTIHCVNHSGTVPPVSADYRTTATISTTGASVIQAQGYADVYGIAFSIGGGGSNNAFWQYSGVAIWTLTACKIILATTVGNANGSIVIGGGSAFGGDNGLRLVNTPVKFGATGQRIGLRGSGSFLEWSATASAIDAGGSIPSKLFDDDNSWVGRSLIRMEGVDLSGLSTNALGAGSGMLTSRIDLLNCKLPASFNAGGNPGGYGAYINVINSDNGAVNYRNERWTYQGSQVHETTVVRTGGATDGTTPISTKIVTTANAKFINPYASLPMTVWNDTTAANVTVTVYGIWGGGAVPNNDDIWIEVSYMGSSATPISTINTANRKADFLATAAGQTSDSSTWGGSTTKFKMTATLSSPQPGLKGPIYVTVKAAAASSTFYIDPKVVLS